MSRMEKPLENLHQNEVSFKSSSLLVQKKNSRHTGEPERDGERGGCLLMIFKNLALILVCTKMPKLWCYQAAKTNVFL